MAQAGNMVANLKLRIDNFQKGLEEAKRSVDKFGKNFKKTSEEFKKVGTGMIAVGTGIGLGFGGAVKTAADFEKAMSRVGALSGATADELKAMTDKARELGATTAFSASQAAEGMQYLAMAGWKTSDIIEGMAGVLDMAAAGQVSLGDAANIASNIMSGFNIEASKSGYVADVLTKAFTSSNTTLHGIGETMKYVAPAAHAVGLSLEEMAAAAGKLGDVGIDASMAGTSLRAAITRLAAPTGKAKQLIEDFGIKITDAEGRMRPLADILQQMNEKFADLTEAEKAAVVQTIFGTEAMSAMLALMSDAKGLEKFTRELEAAGGTAEKIATKQMDNLHGVVEELGGAFEEIQISLGNALIPVLKVLVLLLTSLLTWFNELPDSVKTSVATFLTLSSVLFLAGGGFLLFIGFLPNIINGFKSLSIVIAVLTKWTAALGKSFLALLANPVTWAIVGIATLAAGIFLLVKHFDFVKAKLEELGIPFDSFHKIITLVVSKVTELWERFKESFVFETLVNLVGNLVNRFKELVNAIKVAITQGNFTPLLEQIGALIPNIIMILIGGVPALIAAGLRLLMAISDGMGIGLPELTAGIVFLISTIIGKFIEMLPVIVEVGLNILLSLIEGIISALPILIHVIMTLTMSFVTTLLENLPVIIEAGIALLLALIEGLTRMLPELLLAVVFLIGALVKALIDNLPKILKAGADILFALIEGMVRLTPQLISTGFRLVIEIVKAIVQYLPRIVQAGDNIVKSLIKGIISMITNVVNTAKSIGNRIIDVFKGFSLKNIGLNLIKGLFNGMNSAKDWVLSKVKGLMGSITTGIKNFFKIKSPSQLFRDEIGVMLMRGIEVGIEKMAKAPVEAVKKVAGDIMDGTELMFKSLDLIGNIGIQTPTIGNVTQVLEFEPVPVRGSGFGGETNYNAPLVQVENMTVRDDEDVRQISRELFNLQRSHDRAKGGR